MTEATPAADSQQPAPRRPAWAVVVRVLYVVSILTFLLPFAAVRSCSTHEVTEYTGFGLVAEGAPALLFVLGVSVLLFTLSFAPQRRSHAGRGLFHAGRALLAGLAFLCLLGGVSLQFLFQASRELIGLYICAACWLVVYGFSSWLAVVSNHRMLAEVEHPRRSPTAVLLLVGACVLALVVVAATLEDQQSLQDRLLAAWVTLFALAPLGAVIYFTILAQRPRPSAD